MFDMMCLRLAELLLGREVVAELCMVCPVCVKSTLGVMCAARTDELQTPCRQTCLFRVHTAC